MSIDIENTEEICNIEDGTSRRKNGWIRIGLMFDGSEPRRSVVAILREKGGETDVLRIKMISGKNLLTMTTDVRKD